MARVLVTGFAPFGGEHTNPSWSAAEALAEEPPAGLEVAAAQLPVDFARSLPALESAVAEHRPEFVLCLGQAGGRTELTVERVAVNLVDARIPDNAGRQPSDEAVVPGGPAAYFAPLPVKACVAAARSAGAPAAVSHTAGTYVCNQVFYGLAHLIAENPEGPLRRGGFVHLPYADEQALDHPGRPSMATATMVTGLRAMLLAGVRHEGPDLALTAGTEH